jgi:hypothetical protein
VRRGAVLCGGGRRGSERLRRGEQRGLQQQREQRRKQRRGLEQQREQQRRLRQRKLQQRKSGTSSGVTNDGGTDGGSDGGVSAACPPAPAPIAGSSCTTAGLECEYGLSTVLGCDTLATCTGGAWSITAASAPDSGLGCDHPNGATCPPTLIAAAAPDAGTCSVAGTLCDYLTGRCECTQGSGGVVILIDAGYHWTCVDPGAGLPTLASPQARRLVRGAPDHHLRIRNRSARGVLTRAGWTR